MSDVAPGHKTTFQERVAQLVRLLGSPQSSERMNARDIFDCVLGNDKSEYNWLGNIIEDATRLVEDAAVKAALNGKKYTDENFIAIYAHAKEEGRQETEGNSTSTVSPHAMAMFCLNSIAWRGQRR
jgi:hypothetical protein